MYVSDKGPPPPPPLPPIKPDPKVVAAIEEAQKLLEAIEKMYHDYGSEQAIYDAGDAETAIDKLKSEFSQPPLSNIHFSQDYKAELAHIEKRISDGISGQKHLSPGDLLSFEPIVQQLITELTAHKYPPPPQV